MTSDPLRTEPTPPQLPGHLASEVNGSSGNQTPPNAEGQDLSPSELPGHPFSGEQVSGEQAPLGESAGQDLADQQLRQPEPQEGESQSRSFEKVSSGQPQAERSVSEELTPETLVAVRGLHKAYRSTLAVKNLNFTVNRGEVVGLVGPNGAGKTTTMRSIAGIIPPTEGKLIVAGYDVLADPVAAKRNLAYIPDDPKLFDSLTVAEHLDFVASAYGLEDYQQYAEELLKKFELWEKRSATAGELSRGMRQKAAICCAYLHRPQVIMFDEPHTGLDPRGIRTMKQSILEQAEGGAAIIVSSHLLYLVEDLCSHLMILHKGESLFFGALSECRAAFRDLHDDASLEEVFLHATAD